MSRSDREQCCEHTSTRRQEGPIPGQTIIAHGVALRRPRRRDRLAFDVDRLLELDLHRNAVLAHLAVEVDHDWNAKSGLVPPVAVPTSEPWLSSEQPKAAAVEAIAKAHLSFHSAFVSPFAERAIAVPGVFWRQTASSPSFPVGATRSCNECRSGYTGKLGPPSL